MPTIKIVSPLNKCYLKSIVINLKINILHINTFYSIDYFIINNQYFINVYFGLCRQHHQLQQPSTNAGIVWFDT